MDKQEERMVTRSMVKTDPKCQIIKQVPEPVLNALDTVDGQTSINGYSKRSYSKAGSSKSTLMLARAKEQQLASRLEQESKMQEERVVFERYMRDKEKQLKLQEARDEVVLAELQAAISDEEEFELKEPIRHSSLEKVEVLHKFLDDCRVVKDVTQPFNDNAVAMKTEVDKIARLPYDLPKVSLSSFSGNTKEYWTFTKQFDLFVESRTDDPGQRLLYLMHYCTGEAKESILNCLMKPPCIGYEEAREILREIYGQPYMISSNMVEDLLNSPRINPTDPEALYRLYQKMNHCLNALEEMDYMSDLDSVNTIERIVWKLPLDIKEKWGRKASEISKLNGRLKFKDLTMLIKEESIYNRTKFGGLANAARCRIEGTSSHKPIIKERQNSNRLINAIVNRKTPQEKEEQCFECRKFHSIKSCPVYLELSSSERWVYIKERGCCFKCLRKGHSIQDCPEGGLCGISGCTKRHHESLHPMEFHSIKENKAVCNNTRTRHSDVSIGIIPVKIKGPRGEKVVYALLDSGSTATLIKEEVVEKLGLQGSPATLKIQTVTSTSKIASNVYSLTVKSMQDESYITVPSAYAVKALPADLRAQPRVSIASKWSHLKDVDFQEANDKDVCMLIGCDVPEAHWVLEQRIGSRKQPFAAKTLLGWILLGPTEACNSKAVITNTIAGEDSIWNQLKDMYNKEFEDWIDDSQPLTSDEQRAIGIVEKTAAYNGERYSIPLPWKSNTDSFPFNRWYALKRLNLLKRKFSRNEGLIHRYDQIITEQIRKGFVERVNNESCSTSERIWYLPHHPVMNPKKPDKVRIVFDCAAKCCGVSLNDKLHQGPDTTTNLVGILLRFRKYPIAIAADIEEMFLQVMVPTTDRDAMRFLWWTGADTEREPACFRMKVHPFGATSSPFCANFALRKTVTDHGCNMSSEAKRVSERNFYVDDCIASLRDIPTAKNVVMELSNVLKTGGFRLRKWISNKKEVLSELEPGDLSKGLFQITDFKPPVERTLGIIWDPEADEFRFQFDRDERTTTRRGILGCVSSIFDPLGLVAPLILTAKIILQEVCRKGLGWDEPLENDDMVAWTMWKESMSRVYCLSIPRCVIYKDATNQGNFQLHVFSDASEKGYGAVAYVRHDAGEGLVQSRLLMAKARVAPIKTITIPRLELTAAVLAVRMLRCISRELDIKFESITLWTDSVIVLRYLHNTTRRFCTFVANRIQEIHESTKIEQWKYVSSKHNPADLASRGMQARERDLKLWLEGPEFLLLGTEFWPIQETLYTGADGLELKRTEIVMTTVSNMTLDKVMEYYSSWCKMQRAIAWWTRYKDYIKWKVGINKIMRKGPLTNEELALAEYDIVKYVQRKCFPSEYLRLSETTNNDGHAGLNKSELKRLSPIMSEGLLRVGGRMQLSNWSIDSKHPMIIPKDHPVTAAIVSFYHRIEGHGGVSHVLAAIRRRFWIVQGGSVVKRILQKCLVCKRQNAVTLGQQMAPLPLSRVEQGWYPFQHVGVDYFGPFMIKRGRRMEKRYGCLFTCLQCRAIHIELAHSLSTDSFIMALMRFVNRRGTPKEMISDNGGNFVGTKRELREWLHGLCQDTLVNKLNENRIKWSFNPPRASHRGGVWERLIRSIRKILIAATGTHSVDEETLLTFLSQAERIINDRPLTVIRDDVKEPSPLRPSDLIQPRSDEVIMLDNPLERIAEKRWRIVNNMTAAFWKRWRSEYLPTLQTRQKWLWPKRELKVGDLVIIVTESTPKGVWPLGIIENVYADGDGIGRTVDLKTTSGTIKRDIRKVCLLEGIG